MRTCPSCGNEYEAVIQILRIGNFVKEYGAWICPVCQEKKDKEAADQAEAERLMAIASVRRQWRESCGIPWSFMGKTFENFDRKRQLTAYNRALRFADEFPIGSRPSGTKSLLLYSVHPLFGVGKTHLTAAIAHRILDRWHGETDVCPLYFTTETDVLLRIRSTYNLRADQVGWHEREEDIFNQLKSRPLLVLDDVGKEQPQDARFTQRVYFHIIDGRYQRGYPIVITSNMDLGQLADHIGGAATDRLVEMTGGQIVEFKGESYRWENVKR